MTVQALAFQTMKQKIPYRKSISLKFSLVIICGAALVILTILFLSANRHQHNTVIYQDRKVERQESFHIIADLDTQSLKGLTIENTYWDDMVNFINQKFPTFENDVLRPQLESYHANAIWTYNTQYKLVSNTNTFDASHTAYNLKLTKADINNMFKHDYFVHFYRQSDMGTFEVFGATVHASSDPEHKTANKGYFFISHQLDAAYIKHLEAQTKDSVTIESVASINKEQVNPDASTGIITFFNDLKDENNQRIGRFKVSYKSAAIAGLYQSNSLIIDTVIGGYILITIAIYYLLRRIIIAPISVIYDSLVTDQVDNLSKLAGKDTELGRIAALIKKAEEQKDALATSAQETQKAREALEARSDELESINALMVDRELKMIELKSQNETLKHQPKDR